MTDNQQNEKPCLVQTEQGFSVIYKNRSLYSKYNPASAVLRTVQSLNVLNQTLVLCYSPVLGYGLKELLQKAENGSFVLLVENDPVLYEFSKPYINQILEPFNAAHKEQKAFYCFVQNEKSLFELFTDRKIPDFSSFRRCLPVELSGGAKLNLAFYQNLTALCDDAVNRFWRNRITLVKMGRLYARNLLKNLSKVPFSSPLAAKSVNCPILVCASGPSLDFIIERIKSAAEFFYIIAVDNAFLPLLKNGIIPDAVIAVESQIANEKAFLGTAQSGIKIIGDLTSRPHILSITGGSVSFFLSEYENCRYIKRIISQELFPFPVIKPLGSVGLSAVEIALTLRASPALPVFFAGLDFSYTPNKSHCRESVFHRNKLNGHNRLNPIENSPHCFGPNSFYIEGKNGVFITEPALASYGQTFAQRYSRVQNLYDVSPVGMDTNCAKCSVEQMAEYGRLFAAENPLIPEENLKTRNSESVQNEELFEKIKCFYIEEIERLEELKQLLINGGDPGRMLALIEEREYLFLHFADGYKPVTADNTSMLKRIRSEIDFFIKDLTIALKNMTSARL